MSTHLTIRTLLLAPGMLLLTLTACRKDKPEPSIDRPITIGDGGVYIVNEGNFQWGNASVGYYDIASGNSTEDLYQPANGVGVGDVLQSMTLHNGRAYLVVNNSNKVVAVDPNTFIATATITGFNSPRYLLPVSNAKAYVTDLYANAISIVDLNSHTITGHIACRGATEELALAHGKAFVTNTLRNYVYVIDTATDQLVDSIAVSRGGNSIVEDARGRLWVACNGGGGTQPALYRIDPATLQVEAMFAFGSSAARPWRLTTNGDHTMLYFLNDHVYRMAVTDDALPSTPFIPANDRNFYGLGVDPHNGTVYVADAIDYTQRGVVFRYAADGSVMEGFLAGRIPGGFVFR
ncbi:MAG: YncE family protein [Flavobacteriales bacterium]|nr:YncE family protein [Flavobacteriales bacterium]